MRLFNKFESQRKEEELHLDDLHATEESLKRKLQTVRELHEKLTEFIPEDDLEAIEQEVIEQEEYAHNLQIKLQQGRSCIQVCVANTNINANQGSSASVDQTPLNAHTTSNIPHIPDRSNFHRLPKLDLPKFTGNLLDWQAFWDSYESAIHENASLSNVQKFNYLKSSLREDALQTVTGFSLTNANYEKAVSLLHERYGRKEKLIQTYMMTLLEVPAPVNTCVSLREFYDKTEIYIRRLDSLGQDASCYGSLLVPIILQKLPEDIRRHITRAHGTSWTLGDLMRHLRDEINILDAGSSIQNASAYAYTHHDYASSTATFQTKSENRLQEKKNTSYMYQRSPFEKSCAFCKGNHNSTDCIKNQEERTRIVKRDRLCFNCLGKHKIADCRSKFKCKKCGRRHHTSLCTGKSATEGRSEASVNETRSSVLHSTQTIPNGPVLLKTAVTTVQSSSTTAFANILFDEGAQSSFVTEHMANRLHLTPTGKETLYLSGVGDKQSRIRQLDSATLYLHTNNENIPIKVLIVPEISVPIKTYRYQVGKLAYLTGLKLAHPVNEQEDFDIEILIGANHYWDVVQENVIRGNGPTAVQSKVGYLLSGPLCMDTENTNTTLPTAMMNVFTAHLQEEVDLEKFWIVESLGVEKAESDDGYAEYMNQYQNTHIRYQSGKYIAKLPWKEDHPELPSNEFFTKRRTQHIVRKLESDPTLLEDYGKIIADQEQRGFIEKVNEKEIHTERRIHYISHHFVKKDFATTPIRIVYDCSSKASRNSTSLNECLRSTPLHLNELTALLLRFRTNQYGVATYIEKAFLNVGLDEEDRDVTRFFWLSNPKDPKSPLQTDRFRSVLFGVTCSPFILNATILKHMDLHQCEVTERIKRDVYLDNILTSIPDENAVLKFFHGSRGVFKSAGFNLRSWSSNNETLRDLARNSGINDEDNVTKAFRM